MMWKVLLIEDDEEKRRKILAHLKSLEFDIKTKTKKSVREAFIEVNKSKYDLILLDMSLPTFDKSKDSLAGVPQPVGGIEILRLLSRKGRNDKVIIITQYPELEVDGVSYDFDEGLAKIKNNHTSNILGGLLYSPNDESWQIKFEKIVEDALANPNS